jgi:hypothetical protein
MRVQQKNWKKAATFAADLSGMEITVGQLKAAVAYARESIAYADRSGDARERVSTRVNAADAFHESGGRDEAGLLFAEAEELQKESQPGSALLYSGDAVLYCDWLLGPVERDAWRAILFGGRFQPATSEHGEDDAARILEEAERRANAARVIAIGNHRLLDIALHNPTLARVGLARSILLYPLPQSKLDLPHVAASVTGLRDSRMIHHLPKGLLVAALYSFVRRDGHSAREALDEAHEIASRGPMPLYLADIHLDRDRYFHDRSELAKARELIEKHGYWRCKEELEDAEAAAENWAT